MSIFTRVEDALESLAPPHAYGIYIPASGQALPDEFITYILISDVPIQFADNTDTEWRGHVQISYYNRAGLGAQPGIEAAMKAQGFMPGPIRHIPYNQVTRHHGLALEYTTLED